nr:hypothetical protein [Aquimarina algiphila]
MRKLNTYILDHHIKLDVSKFTPINSSMIPTGEIKSVANSPLDFKTFKIIGSRINTDHKQLKIATGYDHYFVLDNSRLKKQHLFMNLSQKGRSKFSQQNLVFNFTLATILIT